MRVHKSTHMFIRSCREPRPCSILLHNTTPFTRQYTTTFLIMQHTTTFLTLQHTTTFLTLWNTVDAEYIIGRPLLFINSMYDV